MIHMLMVPKTILTDERFDTLRYGEKILYALMIERVSDAEFYDEYGKLYIVYPIEQIMKDMRCSRTNVVNMLNQLSEIGLIEIKRRSQRKPSMIYVNDFSTIKKEDINYGT